MMQSQKMMAYVAPLFALTGLYWQFGLVMYWLTTNLWTLGQQHYIFSKYPPPAPAGAAGGQGGGGPAGGLKRAVARWRAPSAAGGWRRQTRWRRWRRQRRSRNDARRAGPPRLG